MLEGPLYRGWYKGWRLGWLVVGSFHPSPPGPFYSPLEHPHNGHLPLGPPLRNDAAIPTGQPGSVIAGATGQHHKRLVPHCPQRCQRLCIRASRCIRKALDNWWGLEQDGQVLRDGCRSKGETAVLWDRPQWGRTHPVSVLFVKILDSRLGFITYQGPTRLSDW